MKSMITGSILSMMILLSGLSSFPSLPNLPKQQQITLINATAQQNEVLQYMDKISHRDMDFIMTMFAESNFNPKAKSKTFDSGICQRHIHYHPKYKNVINDSIQKQVDDCRAKRKLVKNKGGYRFGYNVRLKYKNKFFLSSP